MNCAKCATPKKANTNKGAVNYAPLIRLLKVGELDGEEKFQCPRCNFVFWFPKSNAHQVTFNRSLLPA